MEQGNWATHPRRGYGAWSHTLAQPHLLVSYQETVRVLVLAGDFVVGDMVSQLLDEAHHLLVPGNVGHGEVAGRAFTTVRHALRRNVETITINLTLHKLRAVPACQPQQTLNRLSGCPRFISYLMEREQIWRLCQKNLSLPQWHNHHVPQLPQQQNTGQSLSWQVALKASRWRTLVLLSYQGTFEKVTSF